MKKLIILLLLFPTLLFAQTRYNINQVPTIMGAFVSQWGNNDAGIDSAIAHAGVNGIVYFTPGYSYSQFKTHTPLSGQVWNGNGATLQRQTETVATATATINSTATSFAVTGSVPSTWHVGDKLQIFITQSANNASTPVTISSMSGTTINLTTQVGAAQAGGQTTYVGASIWKVWNQIDDATSVNYSFTINNLTLDGNTNTSCSNVAWWINSGIYARSPSPFATFYRCNFMNMGSDAIEGQGLRVLDCTSTTVNDSFIHLTADFTASPATYPSEIAGCYSKNSNQIASASGSLHSEGCVTFSFTSGYFTAHDNWFDGGLNDVIGYMQAGTVSQDGGTRNFSFSHNKCFNFAGIIYGIFTSGGQLHAPGNGIIDNNEFYNCGATAPFPASSSGSWGAFIDQIIWVNNLLAGGTTITIPKQIRPTDLIDNMAGTTDKQPSAKVNVDTVYSVIANISGLTASLPVLTDVSKNLVSGTIPNSGLTNSTISGISLGSNLANLTAGRGIILPNYNGGTTQAVTLDTTKTMTWLKPQVVQSTTANQLSVNYDGSHTVTFNVSSSGGLTITPTASTTQIAGQLTTTGALVTGASTSNFYLQNGSQNIRSNVAAYAVAGASFTNFRFGFAGTSVGALSASDVYFNGIIGASPITLASSGTHALMGQLAIRDMGTVTNASSVTVTEKALLYVEAPAAVPNSASTLLTSIHAAGNIKTDATFLLHGYTVSTLPTGIIGMTAYVTDSLAPAIGSTVAAGGSAKAMVWYNGTNWTVTGI